MDGQLLWGKKVKIRTWPTFSECHHSTGCTTSTANFYELFYLMQSFIHRCLRLVLETIQKSSMSASVTFFNQLFLTGIESWEKIHISTSTILNRIQLFCIFWLNWFREKVTWVDLKLVVNVLAKLVVNVLAKLVVNVPPNDQIRIC